MTAPDERTAVVDGAAIAEHLKTAWLGRSLTTLDSTHSTNDDARLAAKTGCKKGHVVLADSQTAGRGSRGRSWSSPAGLDLYFSFVLRPGERPTVAIASLTLVTGLAIARALDAATGRQCQVKWPNDVLLNHKKVAGILAEAHWENGVPQHVVVGVGINVNRMQFPLGLDATSLRRETGTSFDRATLFPQILLELETAMDRWETDTPASFVEELETRLAFRGQDILCDDQLGQIHGLFPDGALRFYTGGKALRLVAGRLTLPPGAAPEVVASVPATRPEDQRP